MNYIKKITIAFGLAFTLGNSAFACEDGHWIESVLDGGRLIKLEDGSLWLVAAYDRVTASIWLPVSNVIICDDNRLINEDDNEAVDARRIH